MKISTIEIFMSHAITTFEDIKQNDATYWLASDFLLLLGYTDIKSFQRVIDRAAKAMMTLEIDQYENIVPFENEKGERDYRLTRFACYMLAMNGDTKKTEVAEAQKYFAEQTRKFEILVEENGENLDRLLIRDEITEGNKALATAARFAGVEDFAKFQNAGYRGMYNMLNTQLANKRGVDKTKLMDGMGRTELAANLFRITQTEERIKNRGIKGQQQLEDAHYIVGTSVRNMIVQNTGKLPENLEQEKTLPEVKKGLKKGYRDMKKLDK